MGEEKQDGKLLELSVILSRKVRKGSVRVSEGDLKALKVGMVEDVVVSPVGKNEAVTEMLFSDSKIKQGVILMNVNDAVVIGVEEGDMVTVERADIYSNQSEEEKPAIKAVKKTKQLKKPNSIIKEPTK
jgi:sRNA-binding carbon storage regulator CsrA